VAVARSSSGGVAIHYFTSGFVVMRYDSFEFEQAASPEL